MATRKQYEWDVFVSHAHGPKELQIKDEEGKIWTKRVVDVLRAKIERNMSEPVRFFLDVDDLSWDQEITAQLDEAVDRSRLLLVFLSPEYLKSGWCGKEIRKYRSVPRWPGKESKTGVFFLEVQPVDESKLKPEMVDDSGKALFKLPLHKRPGNDPNADSETLAPFYPKGSGPELEELNKLLGAVAGRMRKSLIEIKVAEEEATASARSHGEAEAGGERSSKNVFLAYPADQPAWKTTKALRGILAERGLDVIEHMPPPEVKSLTQEAFFTRVKQDLQRAACFVQVFSNDDGPFGMTELQYREATDLGLPAVLWRPEELDPSMIDEGFSPGYAVLAKEQFPTANKGSLEEVADAVEAAVASAPKTPVAVTRNKPNVFVFSVDPDGYDLVKHKLAPELASVIKGEKCRVRIPEKDWKPNQLHEFRKHLVEKCNVLIVVHMPGQEEKIVDAIDDIINDFDSKHGDDRPLYIGIIATPPKISLENPDDEFEIFDCTDYKVKDEFKDWLKAIKDEHLKSER